MACRSRRPGGDDVTADGPPLRIGLNAMYWIPDGMGGSQTYFLRLLEALLRVAPQHEYVVFVNADGGSGSRSPLCPARCVLRDCSGNSGTCPGARPGFGSIWCIRSDTWRRSGSGSRVS